MPERSIRIPLGNDQIDTVLHEPAGLIKGWVVSLHGLESNKDGNKPIQLAERLLPKGIGVVRFDFRGCGASTGAFADTNVSTRVADAKAVINYLSAQPGGTNLGLFGSSMGGYVALFLAADPELRDKVKAAVGLASPSNLDDLMSAEPGHVSTLRAIQEEYRAGGYRRVPTGQRNVLLLHGEADETVPVSHCDDVWRGLEAPREKHLFPGCDHRFSNPDDLRVAIDEAAAWFERFLLA